MSGSEYRPLTLDTLTRAPGLSLQLALTKALLPQRAALLRLNRRPRHVGPRRLVPPLCRAAHVEAALKLRQQASQLPEAIRGLCTAGGFKIIFQGLKLQP